MYRYELHVHTAECDLAAAATAAQLVRRYHEAGYHGMVITDHYFSLFYDWFADELRGADHRAVMERRLRGYYAAREEGERLGMTILPGAEVRFDRSPYGVNDFLLLGCDEEFFLTAPRLNELTSVEALNSLLPEGACVVWAHPCSASRRITARIPPSKTGWPPVWRSITVRQQPPARTATPCLMPPWEALRPPSPSPLPQIFAIPCAAAPTACIRESRDPVPHSRPLFG